MDKIQILGLVIAGIGLIITAVLSYFKIRSEIDQARKEFHDRVPNVQIGRSYIMSSGTTYTIVLKFHNLGRGTASNCTVALDGRPAKNELKVIHPLRPGFNEYEVSLELGPDSPILVTPMEKARLWINYEDQWHYLYQLSYPIAQTARADGRFNIQIQTEHPRLIRPKVTLFQMRRHLREIPHVQ